MTTPSTGRGPTPDAGPATPRTARLINDRAAFELLRRHGPLSRTQLRTLTGLSRPTVADLVERLTANGLVTTAGRAGENRRGPNAALYRVVTDRSMVAGVEVRASGVLAVLADVTGAEVGRADVPLAAARTPDRLVLDALTAAGADDTLRAVVVGTPGLVDPVGGDVTYAASLPGWHRNLLPGLRDRLDVPVLVDNEVNLAGLAEHRSGAARGRGTFALVSIGPGLGVAVVLDGRLHRGASGGAGEVGYLPLSVPAGSPRVSTLQELAGGPAILALAADHSVTATDPAEAVAAAAESPGFLEALAERIAVAAAGVCAVLDPGFLVLAGPVGLAGGRRLADLVATRLAALTPLPTEVCPAAVTGDPVVHGAVGIALDMLLDDLFGHSAARYR